MPDSPAPSARTRWFWINLGAICTLAPVTTYWFQQHLQLYLTEIVVVGGAFTIWAVVRLVWGLIEKATKFDAWDTSRQLLSSFAVTRWLVVATLLLAILWSSTGSLYLKLAGNKSGTYQVDVVRKSDGSPLLTNVTLSAGRAVIGLPVFWAWDTSALQCRIVQPVEYEPMDCTLTPGKSTRIAVPGDFKPKEFHLLRIVPMGALYRTLPQDTDQPVTRYDLVIERGKESVRLADVRRQTVLLGASAEEMPLVLRLHDDASYEHFLDTRLRAAGQDRDNASLTAAVLSSTTRSLPGLYVKAGDELTIKVLWTRTDEGRTESGMLEEFPVSYKVTSEQVQTLWLPKK